MWNDAVEFDVWMDEVGQILEDRFPMMFPSEEYQWYDLFDQGMTPDEAVAEFIADIDSTMEQW